MKIAFIFLLVLLMPFAVIGCGSQDAAEPAEQQPAAEEADSAGETLEAEVEIIENAIETDLELLPVGKELLNEIIEDEEF